MVTEYKVIKPFGALKVGDVLKRDEEGFYVYENELSSNMNDYYSHTQIAMNETVAQQYAKSKLIEAIADDNEAQNAHEAEKLQKVLTEIKRLQNKYTQRNEVVANKYAAGKMPTCQKVEHDTVYYNLMKVLNKLESIINE